MLDCRKRKEKMSDVSIVLTVSEFRVTLWMDCFCFVWIVENLVLASYCPVKGENENYIMSCISFLVV